MNSFKDKGAAIASIIILAFVVTWSVVVLTKIDTAPTVGTDGKTVLYDSFGRAKDIFVLVLPLLTTAAGFWLGSVGTAKAKAEAADAKTEAGLVQNQKEALLSTSKVLPEDVDLLTEARRRHPEAFGIRG